MKKIKFILSTGLLCLIILLLSLWIVNSKYKTDFNEYTSLIKDNKDQLIINNKTKEIKKDFTSPYPILKGISINTNNIKGNYTLEIKDITLNKKIAKIKFNKKNIKSNKIRINFKKSININNKHKFSLKITKNDKTNEQISLIPNKDIDLYGGESRGFWKLFPITISLIIIIFSIYGYYLFIKNKNPLKNKPFQTFLVGLIVFSMLYAFQYCMNTFWDETDYILSGIKLTNGINLYSEYLSQHMPFQAFLVAIIHKVFLAFSLNQFRLCWYLIMAIVYSFIYYRYSNIFGKIRMFFLPIIHVLTSFALPGNFIWFIADTIQMLALLVIILEFLNYLKDGELKTSRVIIIGACIFISFTSIFASVYNILIIFIGFIIKEIQIQKKEKRNINNLLKRYSKLLLIILPVIIFLLYLILTKSLDSFIEQAYTFNREIYPKYGVTMDSNNYGKNILQPFYIGILNMLATIPKSINGIANLQREYLTMLILILTFIFSTIKNIIKEKKKRTIILLIFIYISLLFQRTAIEFHSLPAYILLLSILIINPKFNLKNILNMLFMGSVLLISGIAYFIGIKNVITEGETLIFPDDKILIDNTKSGDKIFLDIYSLPSLYPTYKNRKIVNKNLFILPWFMEAYEEEQIEELKEKNPKYVVYNYKIAEEGVWGVKNYELNLRNYINKNYTQIEDSIIYKINK